MGTGNQITKKREQAVIGKIVSRKSGTEEGNFKTAGTPETVGFPTLVPADLCCNLFV